jgi:Asp-tRNA(Asn)/Glu-tRNA(Gln) amidotransferase A subunit family amidase
MAPDVATAARAFTMMSGEVVALEHVERPRVAVPRGWVTDLDEPTAAAWRLVSAGLPEIDFIERERPFVAGLTILLVEAATYHRRWIEECPEKYGSDVLGHLRRGLAVPGVDYVEALGDQTRLKEEASRRMQDIDALLLPATAVVAPPIETSNEMREPLTRFTRPFNTTGQPVVVLPAPVRGLPVGMQVVAKTNEGALRAAMWLEREWRTLTA